MKKMKIVYLLKVKCFFIHDLLCLGGSFWAQLSVDDRCLSTSFDFASPYASPNDFCRKTPEFKKKWSYRLFKRNNLE